MRKPTILLLLLLLAPLVINNLTLNNTSAAPLPKTSFNPTTSTSEPSVKSLYLQPSFTSVKSSHPITPPITPIEYTGIGANLTIDEFASNTNQGSLLKNGDSINANPSSLWQNTLMECNISNYYYHHKQDIVEDLLFHSDSGHLGGTWGSIVELERTLEASTGSWVHMIHLSTALHPLGIGVKSTQYGKFYSTTYQALPYPIVNATLRFWWAHQFDANQLLPVLGAKFKVSLDDWVAQLWEWDQITPIAKTGQTTEIDVTQHITPGAQFDLEFYAEAQTFASTVESDMWIWFKDVELAVTYEHPADPTTISLAGYAFSPDGTVTYNANGGTGWIFTYTGTRVYFDAEWEIQAARKTDALTSFTCAADAANTSWTTTITTTPIGNGYIYNFYTLPSVPGWIHYYSDYTTNLFHWGDRLAGTGDGKHYFIEFNTAINSTTIQQQDNGAILRSPCTVFMRGEQYAVTPEGEPGNYSLTLYSPNVPYDWGNDWIGSGETWTHNNASQPLTINSNGALGTYTVAIRYRDTPSPLHIGHRTTNFSVEAYTITGLTASENLDGTVAVSGTLGTSANGDPTVALAAIRPGSPAIDTPLNHRITTSLVLEHWRHSDSFISSTGEPLSFWFNITNTNTTTPLNELEITMRLVSLAGEDYILFQRRQSESFTSSQTSTFNWQHIQISPVGTNTMLRRGIYRIHLGITGTESGGIYLDELCPNAYLVVTEDPMLDGYITALHQAELHFHTFNTTFSREEVTVPDTRCIAVVEDQNHITTETQTETSITLTLHASLSDPTVRLQYTDDMTITTALTGETGTPTTRAATPFTVSFYADFGEGYELLGKDTVNLGETASITPTLTTPSGIYPLKVNATSQGDYQTPEAEGTLTLTKEVTRLRILTVRNFTYSDQGILTAQLQTDDDEPVAGYPVYLEILDGTWVTIGSGVTNATGHVSILWIPDLPAGNYQIMARAPLAESHFYAPAPDAHGLLVVERELLLINLDTSTASQGFVTAWVTDDNQTPLQGLTVHFHIDGEPVDVAVTDPVGSAHLTATLQPGQVVSATVEEDSYYRSTSSQATINLLPTLPDPTTLILGLVAVIGVVCGVIYLRKRRSHQSNSRHQSSSMRHSPSRQSLRAATPGGVSESLPVFRTEAAEILQGSQTQHRKQEETDS